jgi:hypothetical protein
MTSKRLVILTHERVGRFLAGLSVIATVTLAWLWSPWCLLATAAVAMNLVVSAITDRCVVKNLLIRLGFPGERDVGRADATLHGLAEEEAPSFRRVVNRARMPVN